jgi:beta-barrel assembly-enhancing protease
MFLAARRSVICLLSVSLLTLGTGCRGSGTGLNFFSYEQEAAEGAKYAAQIEKQMPIMTDSVINQYIRNLGTRMISRGIEDPKFDYSFKVVNSSEINAFAIPGGHLYVNLGLLKETANEAELVGVLGHEIGHVVHRHGTKRMTDAMLLQMAAVGTSVAVGRDGKTGQIAGLGVLLFGNAGLLKYGRQAELESDRTGVEVLLRTGYDGRAMAGFFEKLAKLEQQRGVRASGLSQLLATHPPSQERVNHALGYLNQFAPQQNPKTTSPEFEELRRHIAPMVPLKPQPGQG